MTAQKIIMKLGRRRVASLLSPLLVMTAVASLLLFFYSDTPNRSHPDQGGLLLTPHPASKGKEVSLLKLQQNAPPPPHSIRRLPTVAERTRDQHEHVDVTKTSSAVTSRPRDVIVLSLGRSGSSFTANVISHALGVFYYVFEPLKMAEDWYWKLQKFHRTNSADKNQDPQWWQTHSHAILQHFLSCDFNGLDLSLLDANFLGKNRRTAVLAKCVNNYKKGRYNVSSNQQCLLRAREACLDSSSRLLKVIRARLRDLVPLLDTHPDLVVILLVRDPRALLWSWVNVFNVTPPRKDYNSVFRNICARMDDDLNDLIHSGTSYPGRIKFLRYETIAEEPVETSKLIYDFLNLEWSAYIEKRIQRQTKLMLKKIYMQRQKLLDSPFSVVRRNSAEASRQWRGNVSWPFVQEVQRECFGVMRRLGYGLFRRREDLRDGDVPSYDREGVVGLDRDMILQL